MNATSSMTDAERTAASEAAEGVDRMRNAGNAAAEAARKRARQAQDWAREQWSGLQDTVEEQPYRATLWALGIGFAVGVLLTGMLRGSRS